MCLDKITDFEVKTDIGYKIFTPNIGEYYLPLKGNGYIVPVNQWVKEKDYRPQILKRYRNVPVGKYPFGFHIFLSKKVALSYMRNYCGYESCVMKVRFRNVVAKGLQGKRRTVVAKEMMILE